MPYIGTSPSQGVRRVHTYTATANQTTFTGAGAEGATLSYKDSNFVDVYQNGVKLGDADYTATSGTAIVLGTGATVSDLVVVVAYDVFSAADTVSKADGGTFDGAVTFAGGVSGVLDVDSGITVDNITIDGTEIDLSSGNLTIDVAGQLVINSDSGQVVLQDDTVNWGNLQNSSGDFVIESLGTDKDIIFKGLDDSSVIEAMRIDMSLGGFVGIGNAGPSTKLHIRSAQASNIAAYRGGTTGLIVEGDTASYIQMVANKQAPMGMLFDGGNGHNDSARGGLIYDIDTGLSIKSGGSTRWTIDETGNLLPSATSLGVYLGVTSATASNLLGDYEEGTWTPSLSQPSNRVGTWGSTLVGTYTKVGRKVTVHCSIGGSGMYFSATSGYTAVTGFPFAATQPTNSSPYAGAWSGGSVAYSSGGTVYLYASTAYLHSSNSGQSSSGVNSIGFCVTYFVA